MPGRSTYAGLDHPGYTRSMQFSEASTLARPSSPGDDDSLVRWMLSLSPEERLQVLQGFVDSVNELRSDQSTPVQRRA